MGNNVLIVVPVNGLKVFNIIVDNKITADFGASTGGFTQVMLNAGASKVYAIDVGHDQLDPILKDDPRVINMEGVNIKSLNGLPEEVDLGVCDLSYISIRKVINHMICCLGKNADLIILIKPQFEAGKERMGCSRSCQESARLHA